MPATQRTPVPPIHRSLADRAAINRANSQHSTGPRTSASKQRSSQNALRHGLTAATPVLPSEDPAAYEDHRRRFFEEYRPATPTESQLAIELADTSGRLNRIPLLEAAIFAVDQPPANHDQPPTAPTASAANSTTPPPSSNSTNTKEFPGSPPMMALFFQKIMSNASPNTKNASMRPATSNTRFSTCNHRRKRLEI